MFLLTFQDYFKLTTNFNCVEERSEMPVVESSPKEYTGIELVGQISIPMSFYKKRTSVYKTAVSPCGLENQRYPGLHLGRVLPGGQGR